jgi:hypothetical protein
MISSFHSCPGNRHCISNAGEWSRSWVHMPANTCMALDNNNNNNNNNNILIWKYYVFLSHSQLTELHLKSFQSFRRKWKFCLLGEPEGPLLLKLECSYSPGTKYRLWIISALLTSLGTYIRKQKCFYIQEAVNVYILKNKLIFINITIMFHILNIRKGNGNQSV